MPHIHINIITTSMIVTSL